MVATLKVHKWLLKMSALDQSTASMSHIRHYRVLPWATGLLTLLESIAKVPDRQSLKRAKSSIFWLLLLPFLHRNSTTMAEAMTMIQTRKNNINQQVLYLPLIVLKERTRTSRQFSGNPTLMLAAIRHFVRLFIAITSTEVQLSMHVQLRFILLL